MLPGEHSRNNTFSDSVIKKKLPSPFSQVYKLCEQVLNRTQLITKYAYRRFLTFQKKKKKKKCDKHAVGIIKFHHGDIDHETEWDHPPWVEF